MNFYGNWRRLACNLSDSWRKVEKGQFLTNQKFQNTLDPYDFWMVQGKLTSPEKQQEVLTLHEVGKKIPYIVKHTGLARTTVKRILRKVKLNTRMNILLLPEDQRRLERRGEIIYVLLSRKMTVDFGILPKFSGCESFQANPLKNLSRNWSFP
jgi:hypothetical protein